MSGEDTTGQMPSLAMSVKIQNNILTRRALLRYDSRSTWLKQFAPVGQCAATLRADPRSIGESI